MKTDNTQTPQLSQNDVSKSSLLSRCFILKNRLQILNIIKDCTYYNESFKIRRLNKLIFITKRKVRILENHLKHTMQAVY